MKLSTFRGEVWTNVHPYILSEMVKVNDAIVDGNNGADKFSLEAGRLMQENFKNKIFWTYTINGSAANVLALKAMTGRCDAVICAEQTHINTYECGAFEAIAGNKILSVFSPDGKLTPEMIDNVMLAHKKHKYIPRVVAITEPTEFGTLYTIEELKSLCAHAHKKGMYVFIDGARLANALQALNVSIGELIEETGVDAFTFGGTKAGAMFGEMVVFLHEEFAKDIQYSQKQSLQHFDKSKFLGVQIECLLKSGLYLVNAEKSNATAKYLEKRLKEVGIKIYYPVQTNMVFCVIEPDLLSKITEKFDLHYWDEFEHVVRLGVTYGTTEQDVDSLIDIITGK